MKTVGQLKREKNVRANPSKDSLYTVSECFQILKILFSKRIRFNFVVFVFYSQLHARPNNSIHCIFRKYFKKAYRIRIDRNWDQSIRKNQLIVIVLRSYIRRMNNELQIWWKWSRPIIRQRKRKRKKRPKYELRNSKKLKWPKRCADSSGKKSYARKSAEQLAKWNRRKRPEKMDSQVKENVENRLSFGKFSFYYE